MTNLRITFFNLGRFNEAIIALTCLQNYSEATINYDLAIVKLINFYLKFQDLHL